MKKDIFVLEGNAKLRLSAMRFDNQVFFRGVYGNSMFSFYLNILNY